MPDGSIVLMGGYDNVNAIMNDVWRSTDYGKTWTQVTASAEWSARTGHTIVEMPDGSIVLMGGGAISDVWQLQPIGSSLRNPEHTYTKPGKYTVGLQAYNAAGYNSITKTGFITVDPAVCGDGACNGADTCSNCPADCGVCPPPPPVCGDGACNGADTCSNCPADCGVCPPLPPPSFSTISPIGGAQGTTEQVTITGDNFVSVPTVTFKSGSSSLSLTDVMVPKATTITGSLSIPPGAATGAWDVQIKNPDGQLVTAPKKFQVRAYSVTGITPTSGVVGKTIWATIAGTGFMKRATVKLMMGAASIPGTSVVVTQTTKISCRFNIPSNAAIGTYDVVVTNPEGTSAQMTNGFTVKYAPPTVSYIRPASGQKGSTVTISSLIGSGFRSGATITLTRSGVASIAATNVVVSSSTKITCKIPLTGATTGYYNVVVTNIDGQSGVLKNGFRVR
jgi:PKD repeat protein